MANPLEECIGDSSRDVLGNVKRAAKALILAAPRGDLQDDSNGGKQRDLNGFIHLDDLISKRNKLQIERLELAAELQLRQSLSDEPLGDPDVSEDECSKVSTEQRVEQLEEELLSVKLQHITNSKLFDCLHHQKYLMKEIFPKNTSSHCPETSVGKLVHQQTELVSELLYNVRETGKAKDELLTLRRNRASTQCRCRELMIELDELKLEDEIGVRSEEEDSPLNNKQLLLRRSQDEVTLLRHTLLSLITGSGVDWSREDDMCKLVLKLGQHS